MSYSVAETFPPGEFLREELEARNWTQVDLATIMGRTSRLVNEIVNAKRAITPETAKALGEAFGTSPELWMNLESVWQLSKVRNSSDGIRRRAKLYEKFPVKEIIKRGWIRSSDNSDVLESLFRNFFELESIEDEPQLMGAFRRSEISDNLKMVHLAWLYRAKKLAESLPVTKFTDAKLDKCFLELRSLFHAPEEVRKVPEILSRSGIRFLVIEPFPGSKIDGVCFWLNNQTPVVALSLRLDRIDNFWFTLLHELRHVANRDGLETPMVDVDLESEQYSDNDVNSAQENLANLEARDLLIPAEEIKNFIARVSPLYSRSRVIGFSDRIGVHPGIVVGRLHHMGEIPWANLNEKLVKIREIIAGSSITDGWGHIVAIR